MDYTCSPSAQKAERGESKILCQPVLHSKTPTQWKKSLFYMFMFTCVEARKQTVLSFFRLFCPLCFLKQSLSVTDLKLTKEDSPADQGAPGIFPSLPPKCGDYKCAPPHLTFSREPWGLNSGILTTKPPFWCKKSLLFEFKKKIFLKR